MSNIQKYEATNPKSPYIILRRRKSYEMPKKFQRGMILLVHYDPNSQLPITQKAKKIILYLLCTSLYAIELTLIPLCPNA